ncbi:MAG TPA: DUF2127 domain-containing protein [Patescibacteria group bacterium]|nr:DUF2127 domain-containing protein [Patescibacteria group bacterium]
MEWFKPKTLLDKTYEIGIIIKGIDGVLELLGGILVLVLSPGTILRITNFFTQDTLQENPHNFIAHHLSDAGHHLASGQTTFAALFLLTHGLVKVVLVACLLLNKLWAYPWALAVLGLFLVYQIFLLVTRTTFGMAFLTILDAIIIYLVYREWQKVRAEGGAQPSA